MEHMDLLHQPAPQGGVQIRRKAGVLLKHPLELRGKGMGQHALQPVPLNPALSLAIDLKGHALFQQQLRQRLPGLLGKAVAVQPLPRVHVQHRGSVGQHRVAQYAQLLRYLVQESPRPAAGDGHRRPPLRRRPQGADIPRRHRGVVGPQEGAVHIQADELDVRHFFRFTAWRTFSAMPSGVRP